MLYAIALFAQEAAKGQETVPWWGGPLPMFLVIILLFYFLILAPQRRERRFREEMMTRLKKNDRVITNSGIIATVSNIKDEEVTLRIDDTSNARLTVLRSTIARILTGTEQQTKDKDAAKADAGASGSANIRAS
jgi:preprotein translocase subunit YajC